MMLTKRIIFQIFLANFLLGVTAFSVYGQTLPASDIVFDDKMLLEGYTQKYSSESKDILLAMVEDDTLSPYQMAAAVRDFKQNYCKDLFLREKNIAEKILWRRLNRTDSPFVKIEIMHALCLMDRYQYFNLFMPTLINTLDHYNNTVNEMVYNSIMDILQTGQPRPREARLVFNTLRRILYLSRHKLKTVKEISPRLQQKFELIRWAMKILGTQELKKLPSEVINLL